jgi:GC-rich sequence DNA-binding factor
LRKIQVPPVTSVPTLGPAIARLSQTLTNLTVSHASHSRMMADIAEERATADLRETELREMIELEEEKRGWFAAFRDWAESVATFLDEKVRPLFTDIFFIYTDIVIL